MTEAKQTKVSFLIPENLKLQYQELCKKRGGTISHYLRAFLIQELINNNEYNYNQKSKVQ